MRSEMPITSFMSCSISTTVMPRSFSLRMSSSSSAVSLVFMPAAGSSSRSSVGSAAKARAISSRRCAPYGKFLALTRSNPARPTKARYSGACSRARFSSRRVHGGLNTDAQNPLRRRVCMPTQTFSPASMSPNSRMFWKVRAMPRAAIWCGAWPTSDRPWKSTCPAAGRYIPVSTLNTVVLPAPLGPIRLKISPWRTSKSTLSTARKPPNCTVSPRTSSSAMGFTPRRGARPLRRDRGGPPPAAQPDFQPAALGAGAQQPVGPQDHNQDQQRAVKHEAPLGDGRVGGAQQLRQKRDDGRPEHRSEQVAQAAQHSHGEKFDGHHETDRRRVQVAEPVREQAARDAGEKRRHHERRHLHPRRLDAHGLGRDFVLADGHQRPPEPGADQAPKEDVRNHDSDDDEGQVGDPRNPPQAE